MHSDSYRSYQRNKRALRRTFPTLADVLLRIGSSEDGGPG